MMIISIDPGTARCGWVISDSDQSSPPVDFGLDSPMDLRIRLKRLVFENNIRTMVIEKPVCTRHSGSSVSETAIYCGYFASVTDIPVYLITRSKVKGVLLGRSTGKSTDSNLISYLVDKFCPSTPNRGKGSKKDPGFFYGFKEDIWQSYALLTAYCTMSRRLTKDDLKYLEGGRLQ